MPVIPIGEYRVRKVNAQKDGRAQSCALSEWGANNASSIDLKTIRRKVHESEGKQMIHMSSRTSQVRQIKSYLSNSPHEIMQSYVFAKTLAKTVFLIDVLVLLINITRLQEMRANYKKHLMQVVVHKIDKMVFVVDVSIASHARPDFEWTNTMG